MVNSFNKEVRGFNLMYAYVMNNNQLRMEETGFAVLVFGFVVIISLYCI